MLLAIDVGNTNIVLGVFEGDTVAASWRLLTLRWGGFFFTLALLNEIVWRTQSNDVWVAFKFPGIFVLICLFSVAQMPLIARHKLPDEEAEGAPDHF